MSDLGKEEGQGKNSSTRRHWGCGSLSGTPFSWGKMRENGGQDSQTRGWEMKITRKATYYEREGWENQT